MDDPSKVEDERLPTASDGQEDHASESNVPSDTLTSETSPTPKRTKLIDLHRPTWVLVLVLAWPVLAQQVLILTVQISDRFLAGNYQAVPKEQQIQALGHHVNAVGQIGMAANGNGLAGAVSAQVPLTTSAKIMSKQAAIQAAQTNAFYFGWFLNSTAILVTVGSQALVARSIGARKMSDAVHYTNQAMLMAAVFGAVISVLGVWFVADLVSLLRLKGMAAEFAVAYMTPIFALFAFEVVQLAGLACLVGAGDTRMTLWVTGAVAVLNVPFSFALCLGWPPFPRMGYVGIALGTGLSQMLGGIAVLIALVCGRFGLTLRWSLLRPDFQKIRKLLRISVPAGIDSLSMLLGQFWFLSIVNQLGSVAGSAHGIAIGWEALGFLSGIAIGTAGMTLVGQNLGAGNPERAARSGWMTFAIGCTTMTVMGMVFYILARPMFLLFCPHPSQQPIVEMGIPVLQLIAFAMPPLASAIIFTHILRGVGDTTFPVLCTWVGFLLVRIPLAYWLALPEFSVWPFGTISGLGLGLYGAWLAMFADLVLRGPLFLARYASGRWKKVRL
ncbi:MAG: MATE family efflux transporter [Gemmataceae bacterium]